AAGLATPLYTGWLALSTDEISSVHIALLHWISVPYVAVGLIAWARKPDSRFGVLMAGGGFAMGLSTLQFAHGDVLFTIRAAFDVVPAALYLHAYLAFPDGSLRAGADRALVAPAYGTIIELRADLAPADLQHALARALRDPSLTLAYWLPDFESYADLDGRPVDVSETDGRATMLIDRDGLRIAALLHDAALKAEPELLAAVTAAAGMALENGRLHSQLKARLEELRSSRARVMDAGQKERQRLERNLHDGAQQRLIALSLELGILEQQLAAEPGAQVRLDQARH